MRKPTRFKRPILIPWSYAAEMAARQPVRKVTIHFDGTRTEEMLPPLLSGPTLFGVPMLDDEVEK